VLSAGPSNHCKVSQAINANKYSSKSYFNALPTFLGSIAARGTTSRPLKLSPHLSLSQVLVLSFALGYQSAEACRCRSTMSVTGARVP